MRSSPPWGSAASTTCSSIPAPRSCSCRRRSRRRTRSGGRRRSSIMMTHEYPTLNAALGYAATTGRMAATAVHVDVGTQHYGCAIHTARHSGLPVLITAGAPPVAYPGSMRGARDGSHFWVQQTADQNGIVRQYMKWDHRLEYQDNAGLIVSRALQIAQSEPRGPVYLSLPREIAFLPRERRAVPDRAAARHHAGAGARSRRRARACRAAGRGAQSRDRGAALRPQSGDRAGAGAARGIARRPGRRRRRRAAISASRWITRSIRASASISPRPMSCW